MRILIYSHYFAPSIGGVETIVSALATGLSERRTANGSPSFAIKVVTQTPVGDFQDQLLPFQVVRQPTSSQLRRLAREADVVHVAGAALMPIIWGILAGKPVVVEHHGFQHICPTGQLFQEPQKLPCPGHFMAGQHSYCLHCSPSPNRIATVRLWLLTFVRRFLLRRVEVNITPTEWLGKRLELPRSVTVHHGLEAFSALIRVSERNSTPVFVFMGRLVTTKGVHLLLQACKILREQKRPFKLLIIGDGPELRSLETLAHGWQLISNIHFLGRVQQSQVEKVLANADMIVVPSLGGEVFGMVVAESMLRGIPVLASDLGAFVEVIGDSGLTFKTGDPVDLARQMACFLDDPSGHDHLRLSARQRVLNCFSMSRMVDGHASIYERLAKKRISDRIQE
jgi:glycogen synthase